jgi:hypothetical protein
MRIVRPGALVASFLVLAHLPATPGAAQGAPFGPLRFEEGGPLQRIAYTPMVEGADPVPRGRFRAELWMGYSNIFNRDSTASYAVSLDLERLITALTLRYGVSDNVEAGIRLTTETSGGGILDSFLTEWHHLLHVGNADRALYPVNGYDQRLVGPDGKVILDVPRRTMALEDVRLFAKWRGWRSHDGRRVLSLRAVGRIPAAANRSEGQRDDLGLMALGRASWTSWHLHAMLGGSTARVGPELAPVVRSSGWFFSAAVERSLAPWLSGVVEYVWSTPRVHGIGDPDLENPSGNLVFGATGSAGRSWLWDVSFQEDVPPDSPAVDFTLGVRLTRRF